MLGLLIALVIVINPTSLYYYISKFGYRQLSENVSLLYLSAFIDCPGFAHQPANLDFRLVSLFYHADDRECC